MLACQVFIDNVYYTYICILCIHFAQKLDYQGRLKSLMKSVGGGIRLSWNDVACFQYMSQSFWAISENSHGCKRIVTFLLGTNRKYFSPFNSMNNTLLLNWKLYLLNSPIEQHHMQVTSMRVLEIWNTFDYIYEFSSSSVHPSCQSEYIYLILTLTQIWSTDQWDDEAS